MSAYKSCSPSSRHSLPASFLISIHDSTLPAFSNFQMVNTSIQVYLTPVSSPAKPRKATTPIGDGFTAAEVQEALKAKDSTSWHPDFEYVDMEISDLIPGPRPVTFMGRVANIFDVPNSPKTPRSAKGCVKLCLKDGSGAITVRLWFATFLPDIRLGSLVSVWVNHSKQTTSGKVEYRLLTGAAVSNGEHGTLSSSSAPLFASLFPERDRNCHIMLHDNSDDGKMYRTPLDYKEGVPINRLMTLETFSHGGYDITDAKILVVVKSIGVKKRVTRKDNSTTENINLQVHDDTGEATLGLWGTSASSLNSGCVDHHDNAKSHIAGTGWRPGETVLLIQAPGWKMGRSLYLSLSSATVIDVDPSIPDADWLRRWALRQRTREAINPAFPEGVFSADIVRQSDMRCLFTIADLDEFARCSPADETTVFQGYLSVIITNFKLLEYWKRQMLLSGECCSVPVYANALAAECKGCDKEVPLRMNPRIMGQVIDETACIACGKMLFSDQAWRDLLGRGPEDLLRMQYEEIKYLCDRILFTRVTLLFGWTGDEVVAGGRLCILAVEG